ncbi:MAG TPA: carboxypeptidase regulatory-like domain-containing protein, partial [Bryobacteraceae bacterium]|nr:carboxypeptidase regulatory-like domain-containing protein [Bryobacteraceae bacterium]
MRSSVQAGVCLAVLVLLAAVRVQAQTSRGTVTGVVSDSTRASVPGAGVEIVSKETNVVRSTTTNEQGVYRFDAVDPGTYDVSVKAQGFKAYTSRAIPVSAAQTVGVDATLEVGEAANSVEVTADTVALQTESPVKGGIISTIQATTLPVFSRNPNMLALTLPGITEQRSDLPGIMTFSSNGSRGRSNNFLLDGTENNDISVAGQAFQVKNPDAVQEVSIQTALYDAEFGRAGGAVVNTITKSGTNTFHGTLGWVADFTNDDAIPNVLSISPSISQRGKLPPGYEQFYSGTLGGPVVRDRTFFFTSWQEQRRRASNSSTFTTPTQNGRDQLRRLFAPGVNERVDLYLDVSKGVVATGQPFPIDLGNGRGNVEFGTGVLTFGQKYDARQSLSRVDHHFSERDILSVRYGYDSQLNPVGNVNFPGFITSSRQQYHNAVIAHTHVFTPTLTNELRVPFNRITLDSPVDAEDPRAASMPL